MINRKKQTSEQGFHRKERTLEQWLYRKKRGFRHHAQVSAALLLLLALVLTGCASGGSSADGEADTSADDGTQESGGASDAQENAESAEDLQEGEISAYLVTNVYGDGQKPWYLVLNYGSPIDPESVSADDFAVEDYEILAVYTNNEAALPQESSEGQYVLVELSVDYTNAGYTTNGGTGSGTGGVTGGGTGGIKGGKGLSGTDADTDSGTDADADSGTDADADTGTDADADTGTDADADTGAYADADSDTDGQSTQDKVIRGGGRSGNIGSDEDGSTEAGEDAGSDEDGSTEAGENAGTDESGSTEAEENAETEEDESTGAGENAGTDEDENLSNMLTVTWTQTGDISAADGTVYASSEESRTTDYTQNDNLLVKNFEQDTFTAEDGTELMYSLYLPEDYSGGEEYPLILFMPDATGEGSDPYLALTESEGGVIWTAEENQAENPCIVLVPQYEEDNTSDPAYTMELLEAVLGEYRADADRIYLVGQSSGTIRSISMMIDYPDTFAGAMLVAGQADEAYEDQLGSLSGQNIWMICSAGDERAYPGMTAIMEAVEDDGTQVSYAGWSADLSAEEQNALAEEQAADGTSILFTVYDAGTVMEDDVPVSTVTEHMNTWRNAYELDTVRSWLFEQSLG